MELHNSVSESMIKSADNVLNKYVSQFASLYGEENQTCNLHLLLHLPNEVQKFGPLHVMSLFHLEGMNKVLKNFVHGTRYAESQIISSVNLYMCLPDLERAIKNPSSEVLSYCKDTKLSGISRRKMI